MIELRTLGTIDLTHTSDGRRIQSLLAQPKRFALLVYLATASNGGAHRRDALLTRFWPESDEQRARHALRQSLYAIRRSIGKDALHTTGDQDVAIDRARLWSDSAAFEVAIASGDLQRAAELYGGPFLEGFFVSDTPEFDRWAEAERERLARVYASVLERLAAERERDGDVAGAVDWYRRLAAHDPYSSRIALRLMQALDTAGDRTEAIRYAASHATRLRADLDVEPDPDVEAFAERLRNEPATNGRRPERVEREVPTDLPTGDRSEENRAAARSQIVWQTDSMSTTSVTVATDSRSYPSRRLRRLRIAAVLMILLGGAVIGWELRDLLIPRPERVGVVIAPFDGGDGLASEGGEPGGEPRGSLESALELLPTIQIFDGSTLIESAEEWRVVPLAQRIERARESGADYYVAGELLGEGSQMIAIDVYEAESGSRIFHALGGGSDETVADAVQRMGLDLLRNIAARKNLDLGDLAYLLSATNSPAAVARLREGQAHFRRRDMDAAVASFRQAIAADSLCGLAYLRLSVAETWNPRWDYPAALAAVEAGLAHRDRVSPLWVKLLEAQRLYVLHDAVGAQLAFQRIAAENPEVLDAWLGLGESIYHLYGYHGGEPWGATAAFERLIALDSAFAPINHHLVELAVTAGDHDRAERYLPHLVERYRATAEAAIALRFGSASERAEMMRSLDTAERITLSNLVRLFRHRPTLVDSLGQILMRAGRTPDDQLRGAQYRFIALAAQGQWGEAVRAWRPYGGARNFDPWVIHAHLAGYPADSLVMPMFEWARTVVEESWATEPSWPLPEGRDPFRALVHRALIEGDSVETIALLQILDAVSVLAHPSDPEPDALRASLLARLSLLAGDTVQATRHLEAALQHIPWDATLSSFDPLGDAAPQRLLLAELWAAQGNRSRAEQWLRSFQNSWAVGDILYARAAAELRTRLTTSRAPRGEASAAPGG